MLVRVYVCGDRSFPHRSAPGVCVRVTSIYDVQINADAGLCECVLAGSCMHVEFSEDARRAYSMCVCVHAGCFAWICVGVEVCDSCASHKYWLV